MESNEIKKRILLHLKNNQGDYIPAKDIANKLGLEYSTVNNQIKKLKEISEIFYGAHPHKIGEQQIQGYRIKQDGIQSLEDGKYNSVEKQKWYKEHSSDIIAGLALISSVIFGVLNQCSSSYQNETLRLKLTDELNSYKKSNNSKIEQLELKSSKHIVDYHDSIKKIDILIEDTSSAK